MIPSFFKKLGPISSDLIKSSIDCKIVNVSKHDPLMTPSAKKRTTQKLSFTDAEYIYFYLTS